MKTGLIGLCAFAFLFLSCEEIFYEVDITNETIEIIAPKNVIELKVGNQNFSWVLLEGASEYMVQIATPNFENAQQLVLDTVVSTASISKDLTANDFEWRIKGLNSEYETNFTSAKFTVKE